MTDHGCVDMTDKGILERLTASVSLLVQERDCFARERDDALARAERAEANLVDLTPMVADCETLRTLAAAQSKEITRLRFALDATGAERDNAEGRVARLTGEVERLRETRYYLKVRIKELKRGYDRFERCAECGERDTDDGFCYCVDCGKPLCNTHQWRGEGVADDETRCEVCHHQAALGIAGEGEEVKP